MSEVFHLHVRDLGGPNFSVGVDRGAVGEAVTFPEDADFQEKLAGLYDRGPGRLQIDLPSYDKLCSEIGEQLFRSFIAVAPNIHQAFKKAGAAGGPRVALHLPQRLFKLPWEVLRDPTSAESNFIATSEGGSVFRCDADGPNPRVIDYPPLQPPLNFIFVLSNPTSRFFGTVAPPKSTRNVKFAIVDPASFDKYRTTMRKVKGENLGFHLHWAWAGRKQYRADCVRRSHTGERDFSHLRGEPASRMERRGRSGASASLGFLLRM